MKTSQPKRSRVKEACLHCRRQKVKCDGIHPSCGRCIDKGLQCSYMPINKKLKYAINGPVKEVINKLTEELVTYKKIADKYKLLYQETLKNKNLMKINNSTLYYQSNKKLDLGYLYYNGLSEPILDNKLIEICSRIVYDIGLCIDQVDTSFDINLIRKIWASLNDDFNVKEIEILPFDNLLSYWGNAIILCFGVIVLKLEDAEKKLWKQIEAILKIVLWQRDYSQYPHLLGRFLFCFLAVSRIYSTQSKLNSSVSCVLIAHRIAMENMNSLSKNICEQLHIFLILSSNTRKERLQRIEHFKKLDVQNPFKLAIFKFSCIVTGLRIFGNEIDSTDYDELLMLLFEMEDLFDKTYIGEENILLLKACTYALRAELSFRTNNANEGNKWLNSCTDIFFQLDGESIHRLFYVFFGKLSIFYVEFFSQMTNFVHKKLFDRLKNTLDKHCFMSPNCHCPNLKLTV